MAIILMKRARRSGTWTPGSMNGPWRGARPLEPTGKQQHGIWSQNGLSFLRRSTERPPTLIWALPKQKHSNPAPPGGGRQTRCPPDAPQGRKNREGPEETGHGERDEHGEITGQGRPRSLKTVQSAEGGDGKDRERIIVVVRSPCQENGPADAHLSAHKSVLESANPRMDSECASGCTWSPARATARLWDGQPPE